MDHAAIISGGKAILGIEFGSTRIKAVLTAPDCSILAVGIFDWENQFTDGYWTYDTAEIMAGMQACYADLAKNVMQTYHLPINNLASIGFSAMMHGYLALDAQQNLLVPFRTWRNTTTAQAAAALTQLFQYNIPQRWSIAHLYQAMLQNEPHLQQLASITTLAGYIHLKLTGQNVLGVGDASGMFPVDPTTYQYEEAMLQQFDALTTEYPWDIRAILPRVLVAGQAAGNLTAAGAALLDPTGALAAGIPLCPPEGDAGTGMVATNSVKVKTGNVSAGTSVFAMVVLEHALTALHEEIDLVATPCGDAVAMVHCNNCTSDINAWVQLFQEVLESAGMPVDKNALYQMLYTKALEGEADAGGLMAYNYVSGEPITGLAEGRPLFARGVNSNFTLANFMRTHLLSSVASLKIGMDILTGQEQVCIEQMMGHGGFFKTEEVGQRIMATALNTPVSVMETAGEGGAWGIAVLAAYLVHKREGQPLAEYLNDVVFGAVKQTTLAPTQEDLVGFQQFLTRYQAALPMEEAAVRVL